MSILNIYCDESCHLEHDSHEVMVLGAVWCEDNKVKEISERIKEIKKRHGLSKSFEIKWNKISTSKELFYSDLVNYFFDDDDLHFRAVVAPKRGLNHSLFSNTHDSWYYRMYFNLLKVIINPTEQYNIYIDIKDTQGTEKVSKLHEVLCNSKYDFSQQIIKKVQQIRSHESQLLQIADLLSGAISYSNRSLNTSESKLNIVNLLKKRSGYSLEKSTLYQENKLNLFHWEPRQEE